MNSCAGYRHSQSLYGHQHMSSIPAAPAALTSTHQISVPERVPVALAGRVVVGHPVIDEGRQPDGVDDTPGETEQQQTLLRTVCVAVVGGPGDRPESVNAAGGRHDGQRGSIENW